MFDSMAIIPTPFSTLVISIVESKKRAKELRDSSAPLDSVTAAYRAGPVVPEPAVHAPGVELVPAGQSSQLLPGLEVAHADDAAGLIVGPLAGCQVAISWQGVQFQAGHASGLAVANLRG